MSTSPFLEQQKQLYKNIKPCYCKAVRAMVYFNSEGLRHLLYDKHRPRNFKEKHYPISLINYLHEVVTKANAATQQVFANPPCQIWILEWVEVEDIKGAKYKIKVVIRKLGNGNFHFWSVMQKRNKKNTTKNPSH